MSTRGAQAELLKSPEAMPLNRAVNVSSVPQLSPFRYPGGKTWLVPRVRQWLAAGREKPCAEFIELFAGGGSISLAVAAENLSVHVTMVELDKQVAAVWRTIIEDGEAVWLAERINNFNLTRDSLMNELLEDARSTRGRAFQTILKNRTFRGGILAPGSAPLKRGENGKGVASRWYPATLANRILAIDAMRDRITFIEGDGMKVVERNAHRSDAIFFVDPPYTAGGRRAGRRLYIHSELAHENLFKQVSNLAGDFLMTYDDTGEVRELARAFNFDTELVAMKTTHHAQKKEMLIGRNLEWIR